MTAPISNEYVALMARYNAWMNAKVYDASAGLDDAARRQDRGAFFGSVHGTLNHLMYGDLCWLERFRDGEARRRKADAILYEDFDALCAARTVLDREISAWAASVSPDWLVAPFTFTSSIDGATRTRPAWVFVTHMFNHQTHHRGQLTTLLTQMGRDVGVTDLAAMDGS